MICSLTLNIIFLNQSHDSNVRTNKAIKKRKDRGRGRKLASTVKTALDKKIVV
jgi:hypothetical protein